MRRIALTAGGLALVVALSACGGTTGGTALPASGAGPDKAGSTSLFSDPQQLVAAAKAGTEKSKSAKFSMEMNAAGMSVKAQGQGRFDGANTAMSMTMDLLGQQMEMRLIGQDMYMKMPESMRAGLGGGSKPWTKVSLADSSPAGKALSDSYNQLAEQNDPSKMLEQIQKAGTITKSEATTLDGQPANHYTIDVDFTKLAGQMPAGLPAEAQGELAGKNIHFPMDLWVNSDQLPMQIVMDMSAIGKAVGGEAASQMGDMKMTMKYTDWGAPVTIEAPPADQVETK
jgi:hypothetical protein